jgi:hypothetical protein
MVSWWRLEEANVACFKILSQYLPGRIGGNKNKVEIIRIADLLVGV